MNNQMDNQKKIHFLIDSLKDNQSSYADNVWKTVGFFVIILGWIGTSSEIRDLIDRGTVVKIILSIPLIIGETNHIFMEIQYYRKSNKILKKLSGVDDSITLPYSIDFRRIIANSLIVTSLITTIILLIWT